MGYYSHCRGEITFAPPLPWDEIKNSRFLNPTDFYDIEIELEAFDTGTEEGMDRVGRKLVTPEGDHKFYEIEARFQEFAEEFDLSNGRATGYILRIGEEAGDVQRYYFNQDGQFQADTALLTWPDGTKVEL